MPLVRSAYGGFADSLRDYLSKHDPTLKITADTARGRWLGETMDYSMAIESMRFLDSKAQAPPAVSFG